MKKYLFIMAFMSIIFSGCVFNQNFSIVPPPSNNKDSIKNKVIETVGYGSTHTYKGKPAAQQKLLAIRAARLDAYRNLAEEVYGIRIKGGTTVQDMVIKSEEYSVMLNAFLRGAHINSIVEKENGLFEANASLTLTPRYTFCLSNPDKVCLNSSNQYQSEIVDVQAQEPDQPRQFGLGIFPVPTSRFHID